MALALALVFRVRRRMLPLALALAAAALTFGAMSLAGASLTIASIAVLPVLVGLAVDYAIQFQSRFNESASEGLDDERRAARAGRAGGPVIATAGAATAAGFLVLLLSPVPMVRGFGVLLVVGIVLAFAVTLTAGFAVLGGEIPMPSWLAACHRWLQRQNRRFERADRFITRTAARIPEMAPRRWARSFADFVRAGVAGLAHDARLVSAWVKRAGRGAFGVAIHRPARVLAVAILVAAAGWLAATQLGVNSEITKLVPSDQGEVQDLETLQNFTGTSGEVNVIVRSEHLLRPQTVRWMADYQSRVLRRHGFKAGRPCREAQLCPALSLVNLFGSGRQTARSIQQTIDALPRYFSQNVITADRRTANLAFGIRTMPLDKQKELIDDMRAQLDPPAGVDADVAGLPVLAADTNADLESSRWLLSLAGLAAVFIVLLLVYRRLEAAVVPLVPVALATGWSALILWVLQISLNPMSVTLGALVIAITTEFGVILSARYREERGRGLAPDAALARTYERTGAAVLASGITVIAGFAALLISDFPMLRDFGAVTVVNLGVSLLGVMMVLPAALVWAEQRGSLAQEAGALGRAVRRSPAAIRRGLPKAGRRLRSVVPSRK
jgi:hydrophobe/amphiphile efflux-3 (HAE3) family protein